jgi:phosphoribosyl 1,2-cyclic phosphodiesterase
MKVTFWGTRGSLASPGPETVRYGGNTACVEIRDSSGAIIILDAGTGIRRLGTTLDDARKIHLFLTHLHLDHLQGLGFFAPLFRPEMEVHIWGPPSLRADLATRLNRYLSPPLFPVRLKELASRVTLHSAPMQPIMVGNVEVVAEPIIHPGPTVGYRLSEGDRAVSYMPDHEPALGVRQFPEVPEWTSGYALARGVDLLIHDAQYTAVERSSRIGWGHSSLDEAVAFADSAGAAALAPFHHDPTHSDAALDALFLSFEGGPVELIPATEGTSVRV